jgi:DHA3 family macrolide efflux protein-like MFS transporter
MKIKPITAGLPAFALTWIGQVVSLVGSGLTSFALAVWVFERTGSPTLFAIIGLSSVLPRVIFSPVAGALVDRWDRRKVMILADAGAGLSTTIIAVLLFANRLELWHIYLTAALSSAFGAFQWPAYTAVVSQLVSHKQLGRANGMNQFGRAAVEILSPMLAGVLVLGIGLEGVILIDVATFLVAMLTLSIVRIPILEVTRGGEGLIEFKRDLIFG